MNPREHIGKIQEDFLGREEDRLAQIARGGLETAEDVHLSVSHFLREMIQNTEDALRLVSEKEKGIMEVSISKERKRIRVVHDGKPFSKLDVDAICNLRVTTKEPVKGMLGYLGMGFKSVFMASNEIHIYSDGYRFKFDEKDCPNELGNLWMVFPIWIEEPVEAVEDDKTTFLMYLKSDEVFETVREDLEKIGPDMFLFLDKLSKFKKIFEDEDKIHEFGIEARES